MSTGTVKMLRNHLSWGHGQIVTDLGLPAVEAWVEAGIAERVETQTARPAPSPIVDKQIDPPPETVRFACPHCAYVGVSKHGLHIHIGRTHKQTVVCANFPAERVPAG